MPTKDQIKDAIYDWLAPVSTPAPVDWEDVDDADRKDTRVSLRLIEGKADAFPDVELNVDGGGTGSETITETALLTLVINTRGKDAEILADKIRASVWSSQRSGFDALWKYVGLGSVSTILDLSELESAQIDARYEFRVKLHTTLEHTFAADYAETVEVTVNDESLGKLGTDPHIIPEDCQNG